jgi:collagenase-like PrtC family protease
VKLSLSSISGHYGSDAIAAFYREAAACPDIDRAYIGEMFCAKRLIPLRAFEESVKALEDAGKQAVFSTLALPSGEADFEAAAPYVERTRTVEVNNLGFVPWLAENFPDKAMVAGPICNLYSRDDLEIVRGWGCSGVSLHIDLMPETVLDLCGSGVFPVEVFLHGRAVLAFSWRCYAARFAGRAADACGHVCREQDGLVMRNLEGEDGFVIDGTAVLSGQVVSTAEQARDYADAGAALGRLWLKPGEIEPVAATYAALLRGDCSIEDARARLDSVNEGPTRYGPVANRRLS